MAPTCAFVFPLSFSCRGRLNNKKRTAEKSILLEFHVFHFNSVYFVVFFASLLSPLNSADLVHQISMIALVSPLSVPLNLQPHNALFVLFIHLSILPTLTMNFSISAPIPMISKLPTLISFPSHVANVYSSQPRVFKTRLGQENTGKHPNCSIPWPLSTMVTADGIPRNDQDEAGIAKAAQ